MSISKAIEVIKGKSWILVYEYPDESLVLEGIQADPDNPNGSISQRIRFSKEAVSKLVPLMTKWLQEKRED